MIFLSIERLPVITTANIGPPPICITQCDSYVKIHITHPIIRKNDFTPPQQNAAKYITFKWIHQKDNDARTHRNISQ